MSKTNVKIYKCAIGPAVMEGGGGVSWVLGKPLSRRDVELTLLQERREPKDYREKNQPSEISKPHSGGVYLRHTGVTSTMEGSTLARLKMKMDMVANLYCQADRL